jgi:hypothetical protein
VFDTGIAGDGIGTATTMFSRPAASYCVVSSLVAGSSGGVNQQYIADNAESADCFHNNVGVFATGG